MEQLFNNSKIQMLVGEGGKKTMLWSATEPLEKYNNQNQIFICWAQ